MPETKAIATITQVTDDDTGMYFIGEIDGLFQREELIRYLKSHGKKGKQELHEHLAYMQSQVIQAWRDINSEKEKQESSTISKPIKNND